MSDAPFDPYYKWLGIPPKDQPPNLYRLLGIAVFEEDLDVIESAAQRQISHLRTFAIGRRSELSQELLNEVASARATLLNPSRKAEYDQTLMQSQAASNLDQERSQRPVEAPSISALQVPPPSFSPSVIPAQRTSRRKAKNKSSWSKPLLVSGLLVVSVVLSIPLLKALQKDTEVAQVPSNATVQAEERSSSQGPTFRRPSVNRQQATTSANPEADDTSSQSSDANSAQAFTPAATTSSNSDQLPPTASPFQDGTPPPSVAPARAQEKGPIDLLAKVDVDAHQLVGSWERTENGIIGTGTSNPMQIALLEVPFASDKTFAIEFDIKRTSSHLNGFVVRIPFGKGSFVVFINKKLYGIPYASIGDETRVLDREKGAVLDEGLLATIRCEVHDDAIAVVVDGTKLVSWEGDPSLLDTRKFPVSFADDTRPHAESPYELPNPDSIYVCASHDVSYLISRIELFPDSNSDLDSTKPPLAIAPFDAEKAKQHQQAWADYLGVPVEYTNSIGMKFRLVPPGTFMMGSEDGREVERPLHQVTLPKPFMLGVHEVTQKQYQEVMGANPSYVKDGGFPVEMVSWADAVDFCRRLSSMPSEIAAGRAYRLPTESEWEHACRAGTTAKYYFGDDIQNLVEHAWHKSNSGMNTHTAGVKLTNAWGLHDVHGNVWEWCQDWIAEYPDEKLTNPQGPTTGSERVIRGGAARGSAEGCRTAYRQSQPPATRNANFGFRVVCDLDSADNAEPTRSNGQLSQRQLSELLINNMWQLDYFSSSLNRRRQIKWRFLQTGEVLGVPHDPSKRWKTENDTLITIPDGTNWKYNQDSQRWEDVRNNGLAESKRGYIKMQ